MNTDLWYLQSSDLWYQTIVTRLGFVMFESIYRVFAFDFGVNAQGFSSFF